MFESIRDFLYFIFLMMLLVLFLSWGKCAMADELLVGAWSHHDRSGDYNSNHNLLGYKADNGITIATFENSYYKRSWFAGKEFGIFDTKFVDFSVSAGAATGYQDVHPDIGGVSLYGFFSFAIQKPNSRFGILINTIGTVSTIGFTYRL